MTSTTSRGRAVALPETTRDTAEENLRPGRLAVFECLTIADFRRLWGSTLVSSLGSWIQLVGSGWLVLQLTNSPFWLGLNSLATALPILFFSLFAGVLVDRVDRRRVLLAAQSIAAVSALTLGLLTLFGVVQVWHVLALTFCSSTAMAFHMPAWQALVPDVVGKERIMNATGLTSAAFNGAAVLGPAVAGLILSAFGPAACFLINAVSYAAMIWAIWSISTECVGTNARTNLLESLGEGLHFIRRHRVVFALFWLATIASLLGRSYIQVMPVFARDVLQGGPRLYGILMAASGVGALAGSLATASLSRFERKGLLLLASAALLGGALVGFGLSHLVALSLGLLVLVGGGTTLYMGATTTLLQQNVPDDIRGRIMSVYSLIAAGVMPLGGMLLGSAASLTGNAGLVVAVGGAIVVASALAVGSVLPPLRRVE